MPSTKTTNAFRRSQAGKAEDGISLMTAAAEGDLERVKALLAKGVDINTKVSIKSYYRAFPKDSFCSSSPGL